MIINRTATETTAEWMKGLTAETRTAYTHDRDGWTVETTETIYRDENGTPWKIATDRDGWEYRYTVEG